VTHEGRSLRLGLPWMLAGLLACTCSRKSDPDAIEPVHESVASSSHASPPADDDLGATIDLAISMLENESYREFLDRFIAPMDRPKVLKEGGIEKLLPSFAKDKAQELLAMLRAIRGTKPRMSGDEAVFGTQDKDMHWVLDHGKWYIRN
jgi:hypothetical protein